MKSIPTLVLPLLYLMTSLSFSAIPDSWISRGIGGGGSLFSPSINPADTNEFYVACDMSELFHSADFGLTYTTLPFYQIQCANYSRVCFTNNPLIRYSINYANDMVLPAKSTDGGSTWTALLGNPDNTETTYAIYADYANPGRVIISYYGGIYASVNGGTTFTNIHTAVNSDNGVVLGGAVFFGDTIILGTSDGLVVSKNGGTTFATVAVSGITAGQSIFSMAGARQGGVIRLFCLTGNTADIYPGLAGTDYGGFMQGVYSLDFTTSGATWVSRMTGLSTASDFPMYAAMAENNIVTAYLAGSCDAGVPSVYKTVNAGASWANTFTTGSNQNIITGWSGTGGDRNFGYGECVFGIAVAPTNANKVIISDMGFVHKSANGGTLWQQAYVSTSDQHAAGSQTPTGASYHSIGLENTSCWQVFWADSLHMFAPYTDIRAMRSTDAGSSWSFNYTGLAANTTYRVVKSGSTLYAATSNVHDMYQSTRLADAQLDVTDAEGKILFSTNQGATWQNLHTFGHPVFWLALDPNNANKMYASVISSTAGGVYVTNNLSSGATSTWTPLPSPARTEGHPACLVVLKDSTLICTYSGRRTTAGFTASSGTFVYKPSTNAWTDVSQSGMYYWTKDIIVDTSDILQNTWYVCVFSGWGGAPNGLGGIYRTTNRGTSWTKINSLDRVTSLTFNPQNQKEVYITTETSGLWHTDDISVATPTITRTDSYPFRQPERVFFNPYKNSEIWVTSFGNGMRVGTTGASGVTKNKLAIASESGFKVVYNCGNIEITSGIKSLTGKKMIISNVNGKVLFQKKIVDNIQSGKFSEAVGFLPFGVYVVNIESVGMVKLIVLR